jgi:iron complex outermembrane recepter protein
VTIYLDEAPLPYPAMTRLAAFDLARVEVLKGPQGTLYGLNATGGAVNYIAAKPTESFESGVDATYGRFNRAEIGAFVSGPLSDHANARIALQGRRGDAWQESITRPGDRLGAVEELQGRATVEWHANDRLASRLTFTATHDGSESAATQFIAAVPTVPAFALPDLLSFPVVTTPQSADWTTVRSDTTAPFPFDSDTTLYQGSLRIDYKSSSYTTLTSLTSYADFSMAYGQDGDGTPYHVNEIIDDDGSVSSFFQELRAAGRHGKVNWLVGANYMHDNVSDQPLNFFRDLDVCRLFEGLDPEAYCDKALYTSKVRVDTYAAFGRVEYNLTDHVMLEGAIRYNNDERTFDNCSTVVSDHFARYWNIFRRGAPPPTQLGDCFILDPANGLQPVDNVHNELNEDNVSWRIGFNWGQPALLVYANVSEGYKAGTAPLVGASTVDQYTPVPQESVLAYEAGIKVGLFDQHAQLNAAAFYYDYKDKQLRGAVLDPTFGPLEALVSIPRSHVEGVEAQFVAHLFKGLTLDTSATYVKTEIDEFTGFDAAAHLGDHAGTAFPFSPEWQSITSLDYEFALSPALHCFVGGSLTYNSETFAGVGELDVLRIDAFTLRDLRAGVELGDGRYRVWAWGKNVTNEYYWNNVLPYGNAISRYVGQPATYGVSLSGRF